MTDKLVDARGLPCPEPVVATRKALIDSSADRVRVLVDNPVSVENVERLAGSRRWAVQRFDRGDHTELLLVRGSEPSGDQASAPETSASSAPETPVRHETTRHVVGLISTDRFGTGDDQLGRILMRAFLKTLCESDPAPTKLIFINAGVHLTCEGSPVIDDLRQLSDRGTAILSCGTCLDYYHLVDQLQVGAVTNMYDIVTTLLDADRLLKI